MEGIKLYEEFRLIEKNESEVNRAWKGAQLLLFFMAFVFGSFCTFCFHMMMYLFDEKCVLFPKLLSITSLRHNLIYEFIPDEKMAEMLPVDFVSTHWVDKSACYLPTYVPLVSGIFGLVWTTMFLMCSASSRTLIGLQRPWRVLPPIFVFSLLMGGICVYSSTVTHYGLQELCNKLGEISGSTTCTYAVNVATLVYERRIRGVYQATRLTIVSAWLHTGCWLLSAMLTLVRVLLVVDFNLVRVTAHLQGDIDKMLQKHEKHVRTVTPDLYMRDDDNEFSRSNTRVHFMSEFRGHTIPTSGADTGPEGKTLYVSKVQPPISQLSLVPEEDYKLKRLLAYEAMRKETKFIVTLLYDIIDIVVNMNNPNLSFSSSNSDSNSKETMITRQMGQERIKPIVPQISFGQSEEYFSLDLNEEESMFIEMKKCLIEKFNKAMSDTTESNIATSRLSTSIEERNQFISVMNIASDFKMLLEKRTETGLDQKEDDDDVQQRSLTDIEYEDNSLEAKNLTTSKSKESVDQISQHSSDAALNGESQTVKKQYRKKEKQD